MFRWVVARYTAHPLSGMPMWPGRRHPFSSPVLDNSPDSLARVRGMPAILQSVYRWRRYVSIPPMRLT